MRKSLFLVGILYFILFFCFTLFPMDDFDDANALQDTSVPAEAFADENDSADAEVMSGTSDFATASVSAEATPDTAPDTLPTVSDDATDDPDKFVVSEDEKGFIRSPEVGKIFDEGANLCSQIDQTISDMRKSRDKLYSSYKKTDENLDTFLQTVSGIIGKFEESIDIFEKIIAKEEADQAAKAGG